MTAAYRRLASGARSLPPHPADAAAIGGNRLLRKYDGGILSVEAIGAMFSWDKKPRYVPVWYAWEMHGVCKGFVSITFPPSIIESTAQ